MSAKPGPKPNKYNSAEVLAYLADSFNAYVQQAKQDKSGENIKIYRSLEASSQWKTPGKDVKVVDLMGELNKSLQ